MNRFIFLCLAPFLSLSALHVGVSSVEITPPIGTPSAGYVARRGAGMEGIHDSLLAIALFIDTGAKQIALCSVDHLGYTFAMTQEVASLVHKHLPDCEVYVASSHTHSGGGAYLDLPLIGSSLAGSFDAAIKRAYVEKTASAIVQASKAAQPAKVGIGYGKADNISRYRASWPMNREPLNQIALLKVTKLDGTPYAALFNYPLHPTTLPAENRLFSADFVGYARDHVKTLIGSGVQTLFFNGAQGDIVPKICNDKDRFESCDCLGLSLALTVQEIWDRIEPKEEIEIQSERLSYSFAPKPTPQGLKLPIKSYQTELNLLVFDQVHAFITIPGELSSIYDERLKAKGTALGFEHVSIFGLTNDAHGYIILPEAWNHQTFESQLSFGGEHYGSEVEDRIVSLMEKGAHP